MPGMKLSLDGAWEIALDAENRGLAEGWPARGFPPALSFHPTHVPGIWQEQFPDYTGVAWYRRQSLAPAAWQDQRLAIRLTQQLTVPQARLWSPADPSRWPRSGRRPPVS